MPFDSPKRDSLVVEFRNAFDRQGSPQDAVLFVSYTPEDLLHTSPIFYFSPGAGQIALDIIAKYKGLESEPPRRSEVSAVYPDTSDVANIPFGPAL